MKTKRAARLPQTTRDAINWMLASHEPLPVIQRATGVSQVTLRKMRHEYLGTRPAPRSRSPRVAPETRDEVVRMLEAGEDRKRVVMSTGVSRMYVWKCEQEIRCETP